MQNISKILTTENNSSWTLLRIPLGIVMLALGLQKAFGWFGGYGWEGTMHYFTDTVGMPYFLGAFTILIETLGAALLVVGFAGRINALLLGIVMIGAFFVDHLPNGFYMNWFGNQKGEGYEFDILFVTISLVLVINGSGAYSLDRLLTASRQTNKTKTPQHKSLTTAQSF